MENIALELHDSTLASITRDGKNLEVRFRPGYIHKSFKRPGIDTGTGWRYDVVLVLKPPHASICNVSLPCDIAGGSLRCDKRVDENLIALPLNLEGETQLLLELTSGKTVEFRAAGIEVVLQGTPKCIDDFN